MAQHRIVCDNWIVTPGTTPATTARLICFPYAGGGASIYHGWARHMPLWLECAAVQPPGRETRMREPLISSGRALVEHATDALEAYVDRPFFFFGHSLGGLVAFELARELRRRGLPQPEALFVSAIPAPGPPRHEPIHALPDDEFHERLRQFQGTPELILNNAELMDLLRPVLRADFSVLETYEYRREPPLAMPIFALAGSDDADAPAESMQAWRQQTIERFWLQVLPGDHFFLRPAQRELIELLLGEIRPVLEH